MNSFFRKTSNSINNSINNVGHSVNKAFSKQSQRSFMKKANHAYQDSIPGVRIAGEVAGNLAPVALAIPGYGPGIAMGLKGGQALSKVYAMGENKHKGKAPQMHIMPHRPPSPRRINPYGIQAQKPEQGEPNNVFY